MHKPSYTATRHVHYLTLDVGASGTECGQSTMVTPTLQESHSDVWIPGDVASVSLAWSRSKIESAHPLTRFESILRSTGKRVGTLRSRVCVRTRQVFLLESSGQELRGC